MAKLKDFVFEPSAQSALFAMLSPKQRVETANVFRHIKKASQIELAYILMDYIEDGVIPEFQPEDLILSTAFVILTEYEQEEKSAWAITPRSSRSKGPRLIGDIFREIFNK